MRTNIVLDDDLVAQAMQLSALETKRDVVHAALREFVENRKRLDIRDLRGSALLRPDYNYKDLRAGKQDR